VLADGLWDRYNSGSKSTDEATGRPHGRIDAVRTPERKSVGAIASTSGHTEPSDPFGLPAPPAAAPEPSPPAIPRRRAKEAPRRSRVIVRHVDPLSVLKFSLLFYFCMMLVVMFAFMILYWIMGLTGVLDSLGRILQNAGFGPLVGKGTFRFNSVWIFERLFLIGAISVVVWSLVNLFVALLYNLVSDVVGGVSITLTEKRERRWRR
jgi:Transmembrane domain of unknown function (DUF3566)